MDTDSLLSGFIGSLLGVASGFVGAVYLDWQRARRDRRTHVLALMREILSNNVRVQLALKERRREGALEDRAWRELRVALAGELPLELYNRIASRYDALARSRKTYDDIAEGASSEEDLKRLGDWAAGMMEENERLRAEVGDRQDGLLRALRRRERRHAENGTA